MIDSRKRLLGCLLICVSLALVACSTTKPKKTRAELPQVEPVNAYALEPDASESAEGMTSYFFSRPDGPDDQDDFHEAFAAPTGVMVPLFPEEQGSIEDALGIAQPKLRSFRIVGLDSVVRDRKSLTAPGLKKLRQGQRVIGHLEGKWLRIGTTRYVIHAEDLVPIK